MYIYFVILISRLENWLATITRVKLLASNSSDLEYEKKLQYSTFYAVYIHTAFRILFTFQIK